MQPNTITLPVDAANDANLADQIFTRFDEFSNRSLYIGPAHLPEARYTLGLYRSPIKANGNFRGVKKTSFKLTKDISVLGVDGVSSLTSPIIVETSFSFPVGVLAADVLELRQVDLALIDYDTIMDDLNIVQMI